MKSLKKKFEKDLKKKFSKNIFKFFWKACFFTIVYLGELEHSDLNGPPLSRPFFSCVELPWGPPFRGPPAIYWLCTTYELFHVHSTSTLTAEKSPFGILRSKSRSSVSSETADFADGLCPDKLLTISLIFGALC